MPGVLSEREIVAWLRELVAELLEADIDEVAVDADLADCLYVESLQHLELMTRVEQRLHLSFDIEAWLTPATIADLAQYITAKQQQHDDV